jgi:hypothetical protein
MSTPIDKLMSYIDACIMSAPGYRPTGDERATIERMVREAARIEVKGERVEWSHSPELDNYPESSSATMGRFTLGVGADDLKPQVWCFDITDSFRELDCEGTLPKSMPIEKAWRIVEMIARELSR